MTRRTFLEAAGVAAPSLALVGCSTSPLEYLQLAVGAAEIVLPLVAPSAGIDPATVAAVDNYLNAASEAITQASDILAGTGTDAQKATQILAAFAGIAAPIVPPQYAALASAVQLVAQYIAQFLASLPTTSTATHAIKSSDAVKVSAIKARAVKVHAATARR